MMIFTRTRNLTLAALLLLSGCIYADDKKEEKKDSLAFTTIIENPITSVKNQNKSGTCWDFSSLGFFEAELLRTQKKQYDLCEVFVFFNTMMDRARAAVRLHVIKVSCFRNLLSYKFY